MNRRGDSLVSREFIIMLFAVVGFVIVVFFVFGLTDILNTEEEICKTSVIYRATAPEAANTYFPLKCTTKKVCLTGGGGCLQFAGEKKNVDKPIKLGSDAEENAKKVEETLANEMYDCWNTFGEGKVALFNGGVKKQLGFDSDKVACMICSRITVNLAGDELNDTMNLVDVNEYMRTTLVPHSSLTYLQSFTDRSINSYSRAPEKLNQSLIKNTTNINSDSLNQYAIVFSQIRPKEYSEVLGNLLKLGGTGAGATFAVTGLKGLTIVNTPVLIMTGIGAVGITAYSMSNVYEGKVAAGGYCGRFTSADNAYNNGCSTVQILPYDVNALNSICGYFEGSG